MCWNRSLLPLFLYCVQSRAVNVKARFNRANLIVFTNKGRFGREIPGTFHILRARTIYLICIINHASVEGFSQVVI